MQSEDDGQHASRWVATMMFSPKIINIFKENWIHHQNLYTNSNIELFKVSKWEIAGKQGNYNLSQFDFCTYFQP